MIPRKRTGLNILLSAAALAAALGLCEALVRALPLPRFDKTTRPLFRPHPSREFELIPNVSTRRWGVEWKTNSRGFRDAEHGEAKSGFRILGIGDSFLAGNEVAYEDMFLRRLEKRLGVEVIKTAVSSYGPVQERLLWEEEGRNYRPDIVLLGVYAGNDLYDNLSYPRDYCVEGGQLVLCSQLDSRFSRPAVFLARHSLFARLLMRSLNSAPVSAADVPSAASLFRSIYEKEWKPGLERGFNIWKENVLALSRDVSAAGATLVVLVIPTEAQVYDGFWEEMVRQRGLDAAQLDRYQAVDRLTGALAGNSIRYINLLPVMKEAAKTDAGLHPGHWHWSAAANDLVARTVAAYLKKEGLLPQK